MKKGSNVERNVELLVGSVSNLAMNVESLVVRTTKLEKTVESLAESVEFVISTMVTKSEFEVGMAELSEEMATKDDLQSGLVGLGQRLEGVSNRLDYELDGRKQLEVRVKRLERKA